MTRATCPPEAHHRTKLPRGHQLISQDLATTRNEGLIDGLRLAERRKWGLRSVIPWKLVSWFASDFPLCFHNYSRVFHVSPFTSTSPPTSSPGRARLKLGFRPLKVAKRVNWLTTLVDWLWSRELVIFHYKPAILGYPHLGKPPYSLLAYQPTSITSASMDPQDASAQPPQFHLLEKFMVCWSWSSCMLAQKLDGIETHKMCQFGWCSCSLQVQPTN